MKSAFIGKISGDGMGEYILNEFEKQNIDVSGICIDRTGAKNCLAITEIISADSSGTYCATDFNTFYHGAYDGWNYIFDCGPLVKGKHRFEIKMVSRNFPYRERFASRTFYF